MSGPPSLEHDAQAPASVTSPTGASVARGGIWEIAASVIPQFYVVVQSIFIARYLGPTGVGQVAFITLVVLTSSTLFTLGMPTALLRFTGRLIGSARGGAAHALYRWTWRFQAVAAALNFLLLALVAVFGGNPPGAWVLAGVIAAGTVMNGIASSFLRGMMQWRRARLIGIVSGSVALAFKLVALRLGGGITALFLIDATAITVNVAGTEFLARRAARGLPPPPRKAEDVRPLLRFAGVASLNAFVLLVVYQRTEVFFLAHYGTTTEIAIYAIPFSIVSALLLFPRAVGSALAPAVATLWGGGELERIRAGFGRAMRIVLLLVVLITAVAASLGPTGIRIVYGPKFAGSGLILEILLIALPFVAFTTLSSALLLGIGRQWGLTIITSIAAIANLGLDWLIIPAHGAVGAAVANTLAQLIGSIPLLLYAVHVIGSVSLHFGKLVRAIVAGALAAAVALMVVSILPLVVGFLVASVAFTATFVAVCLILRPIPVSDARWAEVTIGGWGHGLVGVVCRRFSARVPVVDAAT
jgi:O-antigen/teichoic acid export membrane protein